LTKIFIHALKYETKYERNFGQFMKTTSDWKAFFSKFYELEIYPRALSPLDLRSWKEIGNFCQFRQTSIESFRIILKYCLLFVPVAKKRFQHVEIAD